MVNQATVTSVSHRRSLFVWAVCCIIAGVIFLAYTIASLAAGHGELVMPLDDVYIHFQYARQLAAGQPYIYNPGLPPTSGATSFLYPYILAIGYLLGFQGLNLGLWAMLVGMVVLASSSWLVYRMVRVFGAPEWIALLTGIIFEVSGPVSWHFMSGMETGLVVLFTLGMVYFIIPLSENKAGEQRRIRSAVIFATLLALTRPEGAILAVLAMEVVFLKRRRNMRTRYIVSLTIPVLSIGVQPLVNLVLTGSAVASGNTAKSVFGIVPFSWDEVIHRVLDNWGRMWSEFLIGSSPREGLYIAPGMLVLAGVGLFWLLMNRKWRVIGLMLIGWLIAGTFAISTLDTAFWHFKRYQMPFMAMLFPLAALGLVGIWQWGSRTRTIVSLRYAIYAVVGVAFAMSLWTAGQFLDHYSLNVGYIYAQPLQMAHWLQANTPRNAVVAVHDTGLLRYAGGRATIDMVGLTTPGAADYWRNGPGAVAEFLIQQRPDYIASYGYGHGFGLGMIADTDIYGQPLVSFPVQLDPNYNVALAADFQGIYQPDWTAAERAKSVLQPSINGYLSYLAPIFDRIDEEEINVAELNPSEYVNQYQLIDGFSFAGFPTEVREMNYLNCTVVCRVVDGGRRIGEEEAFNLVFRPDSASPEGDVILVTRLHPMSSGMLDIYVSVAYDDNAEETKIATRWIPAIPGHWLEIATLIPSSYVPSFHPLHIRIVPHVPDGYYMPYRHLSYFGEYNPETLGGEPLSTFQNGAIVLAAAEIDYQPGASEMPIHFEWYTDGSAQGDYKLFVHVLDENDQIVAQADTYPGGGTLPPGNWLPGALRDRIVVDLGETLPGQYRVAVGFYNPYTFERLQPTGGDEQGRFFIGEVEIP